MLRGLVISSDHGDHTGGNSALPENIRFWAHPTSAAVLEAGANRPNRRQGGSLDGALQQAQFGNLETWTLRASQGPTAIRRVYLELNGELNQ